MRHGGRGALVSRQAAPRVVAVQRLRQARGCRGWIGWCSWIQFQLLTPAVGGS